MSRRDTLRLHLRTWLRILLPLAALAILSTLFLWSGRDAPASLPFSEKELDERLNDGQITSPSLAGATEDGDLITLSATSARPDPKKSERLQMTHVTAQIDFTGGSSVSYSAQTGAVDQGRDMATLSGNVVITSTTGYRITTEELIIGLADRHAETPGPIKATGPAGTFSAGTMLLTKDAKTGNAHLVFTNGVELVYEPKG